MLFAVSHGCRLVNGQNCPGQNIAAIVILIIIGLILVAGAVGTFLFRRGSDGRLVRLLARAIPWNTPKSPRD